MKKNEQLIYLTSNQVKFEVAKRVFEDTDIELIQRSMPTPEIQSTEVAVVAEYSAKWAYEQLNQPVIVTDAGLHISALKGFPGPFIKYINEWLSADDLLSLMKDKDNRQVVIKDCLSYCEAGKKPVTFCGEYHGTLSTVKGRGCGTPMDQLFIPSGFAATISEISADKMVTYWSSIGIWQQFKSYLFDRT